MGNLYSHGVYWVPESDFNKLQLDGAKERTELRAELANERDRYATVVGERDRVRRTVDHLREGIAALKDERDDLRSRVSNLEACRDGLCPDALSYKKERDAFSSRNANLEFETKELRSNLARVGKERDALRADELSRNERRELEKLRAFRSAVDKAYNPQGKINAGDFVRLSDLTDLRYQ